MGVWDYSILDSDAANEVVDRWNEWIHGPKAIGYERAIERFFEYWGASIEYGDPITNSEIMALLGIHLREGIDIPPRLRDASITAISGELEAAALSDWDDPGLRERVLRDLLNTIGARPKKRRRPLFFKENAIEFRNLSAARRDLLRRARKLRNGGVSGAVFFYRYSMELPPFLMTLQRLMHHRIWEKDHNICEQVRRERCMMLAWYLAMNMGMSEEQMEKLLDDIAAI